MNELFDLNDILGKYMKNIESLKGFTILKTESSQMTKFSNILIIPPEISQHAQTRTSQLKLILSKNNDITKNLQEVLKALYHFQSFEIKSVDGVKIYLNVVDWDFEDVTQNNDNIYVINIQYCLSRLN